MFSLPLPSEGHPSPMRVEVVLPASLPSPGLNFRFRSALSSPSLCLLLPSPSLHLTLLPPLSPSGILQLLHSFSPPPLSLLLSLFLLLSCSLCPCLYLPSPRAGSASSLPCYLPLSLGRSLSWGPGFLSLWATLTLLGLQERMMVWTGLGCGPFSPMDSRTRRAFTPSWGYHGLGETITCLGGGGGLW